MYNRLLVADGPPSAVAIGFRKDIEGLRGIAVLLVVLFHTGVPGFGGGYVGVDVFFVLSGYLITGLLVTEFETRGGIDLRRFYGRRARRLLPVSLLVLTVTVAASLVLLAPRAQEHVAKTAVATALYLSNLRFAKKATDYLGAGAEFDPLLHTWSLGVEEQFYVVWPLLVALALWRGRHWLLGTMGVVLVLSFAASLWLTATSQPWAFFSSPTRAWEFAVGGLASFVVAGALPRRAMAVLGWGGLAAVLVAGVAFGAATPFPGAAALLPVLGTAALLIARGAGGLGGLLALPLLQTLGRLSYGWYLWHWPIVVFTVAEWPDAPLAVRLVAVLAALGLAAASYRWLENPVRHAERLRGHPARSLALAGALTVAGLGVAAGAWAFASAALSRPPHVAFAEAYRAVPSNYTQGCQSTFWETEPEACERGQPDGTRLAVLFGDSQAAQWSDALDLAGRAEDWRVVTFTKDGCSPADVPPYWRGQLKRLYTECPTWREATLDTIAAMRPDLVLVATSSEYPEPSGLTPEAWQVGLGRTLARLGEHAESVVFLAAIPHPLFDIVGCLDRAAWRGRDLSACDFEKASAIRSDIDAAERAAAADLGLQVLDLDAGFCPTHTCAALTEDGVVYRDGGHLTVAYANGLAPAFAQVLRDAAPRRSAQ